MYEQTVHVPALVFGPGRIPEGRRVTDHVALFDFAPTVLDFAGIEVPSWMEATSLKPYFGDAPAPRRNRVYAEHSNDALLTGTRFMTMVLDGDIKLVHYVDSDDGMLFDLQSDPMEQANLWDDPGYAETRERLIDELLKWRLESSLKTQGFVEACIRGCQAMMCPPGHPARGQHREGSR